MNYAKAMKDPKARAAYNKSKGVKAGTKGAASKTDKGKEDFTTKKEAQEKQPVRLTWELGKRIKK